MVFSCKDCGSRNPGCHAKCKTYQMEKAEHDARRNADYEKRKAKTAVYGSRCAAVDKALKKQRTGKRGNYD